jgi:Bacterial regulatory proteins, lacI family
MLAVANGTSGNRVTLTDVAEHAGVSAAAASLALRGLSGVAESTRERVRAAAVDLGYRSRATASDQLTIDLLMKARPHEVGAANAFYGPMMAGINAAVRRRLRRHRTASKIRPRLDTIAVDKPAMGRLAVALLVHRINHPTTRRSQRCNPSNWWPERAPARRRDPAGDRITIGSRCRTSVVRWPARRHTSRISAESSCSPDAPIENSSASPDRATK